MFQYGRKAGIMGVVLLVLSVVPLLITGLAVLQMPDVVPTHFVSGVADRFSNRYELMLVPVLCFAVGLTIYINAGKQATASGGPTEPMGAVTAMRYLRNGLVATIVINVANLYLLYGTASAIGLI